MSFESADVETDFPGLYTDQASNGGADAFSDDEKQSRRKEFGRKKETKKDQKNKGYKMFEEEDSEEELVSDDIRSPSKLKKHSKPSFKFSKREKFYKPKEKDKEKEEKREKKEKEKKEKEERERREREEREERELKEQRGKEEKEQKKREQKRKEKEDKFKFKKKKMHAADVNSQDSDYKPIFGVPLSVSVARNKCHDGILLPSVFRECIQFIEEFGLTCEGIYRISGVKSKVQALKEAYNRGGRVCLHEHEPSIVASLLKQFLRELPEPVLTTLLTAKFEQASALKNLMQTINHFKALIEELPPSNRLLLSWTVVHMTHVIAREKLNKMSLQNVSIVLSPTMQISHRVLNVFFTHSLVLFRDTVIKKYVPPLQPVTSLWSLELPDTPAGLEDELRKQESLLNQLHQQVARGNDAKKEDRLWEVQRVVTQLNRKLKNAMKAQDLAQSKRADGPSSAGRSDSNRGGGGGGGEPSATGGAHTPGPPRFRKLSQQRHETLDAGRPAGGDVAAACAQAVNAAYLTDTATDESAGRAAGGLHVSPGRGEEARPATTTTTMTTVTATATTTTAAAAAAATSLKEPEKEVEEPMEHVDPAIYFALTETHAALILEEEELLATGDELHKKIETEKNEIECLHDEISDLREIYESDSDDVSSDVSSDDSEDEQQLTMTLEQLSLEKKGLQVESRDLCDKVQEERQICLEVKVQIRMIQQWQQLQENVTTELSMAERDH